MAALHFGQKLKAENFQILNDLVFNQVLVACDSDKITDQTMRHIQASGECWVGGTRWNGKTVIRISIAHGPLPRRILPGVSTPLLQQEIRLFKDCATHNPALRSGQKEFRPLSPRALFGRVTPLLLPGAP
jgi:hypothetical protein